MIPLIALFICFLAIAGVGIAYAYNSTIQIDDNPVNEQYFTLDYTDGTGAKCDTVIAIPDDTKDMTITTSVKVDGDSRTFNAVINEVADGQPNTAKFERVFYVKLASNMDADQEFAITGTVTGDTVTNAIFGTCIFKMYDNTDTEVDMDTVVANQTDEVYKVVLTVPINANVNVKTIPGLAGASAIVDANTLATALADLDNHKFSVTLTATPVDPAPVTP